MKLFKGKKTYIVALLAVASAGYAYVTGQADGVSAIQLAITGVLGATLRSGVNSAVNELFADVTVEP